LCLFCSFHPVLTRFFSLLYTLTNAKKGAARMATYPDSLLILNGKSAGNDLLRQAIQFA
jgi:hypothetical protein